MNISLQLPFTLINQCRGYLFSVFISSPRLLKCQYKIHSAEKLKFYRACLAELILVISQNMIFENLLIYQLFQEISLNKVIYKQPNVLLMKQISKNKFSVDYNTNVSRNILLKFLLVLCLFTYYYYFFFLSFARRYIF